MMDVQIQCTGCSREALIAELEPLLGDGVALQPPPRPARVHRSAGMDPAIVSAIVQGGATVLAALIVACVELRKRRAPAAPAPIRIVGADGTTLEIPPDVDPERLAVLVDAARRIDRPRIDLGAFAPARRMR